MRLTDVELTIALISFVVENTISVKGITDLFGVDENDAKKAIKRLIEKKAILNYDFKKPKMKIISDEAFAELLKTNETRDISELYSEYCVYISNISIDGTFRRL